MKKIFFMGLIIGWIFSIIFFPIRICFIFLLIYTPIIYGKCKCKLFIEKEQKKETPKKIEKIEDQINKQVRDRIIRNEIAKLYEEKQKILVKKKVN